MTGPEHWTEADLILTGDNDPCSYGCPHTGCRTDRHARPCSGARALALTEAYWPVHMRPEDRDQWDRASRTQP